MIDAAPCPQTTPRGYGNDPLPTGEQALDEPLRAFPSWFLRIVCDRCGKERMVNEAHCSRARCRSATSSPDASRRLRRSRGEGGAAHRHRGRQQPAGARDRAAGLTRPARFSLAPRGQCAGSCCSNETAGVDAAGWAPCSVEAAGRATLPDRLLVRADSECVLWPPAVAGCRPPVAVRSPCPQARRGTAPAYSGAPAASGFQPAMARTTAPAGCR